MIYNNNNIFFGDSNNNNIFLMDVRKVLKKKWRRAKLLWDDGKKHEWPLSEKSEGSRSFQICSDVRPHTCHLGGSVPACETFANMSSPNKYWDSPHFARSLTLSDPKNSDCNRRGNITSREIGYWAILFLSALTPSLLFWIHGPVRGWLRSWDPITLQAKFFGAPCRMSSDKQCQLEKEM